MTNNLNSRLLRGLPVVFLLAAALTTQSFGQVKPGATPPGSDDPGDVRGHIDIPEIGFGPPGAQPGDLFDFGIGVDDDDWGRPPTTSATPPDPGMGLPPGSGNFREPPELFPSGPADSWDRLPVLDASLPAPGFSSPAPIWAPSSSIPAPGAGALIAVAALSLGGRRRRRER